MRRGPGGAGGGGSMFPRMAERVESGSADREAPKRPLTMHEFIRLLWPYFWPAGIWNRISAISCFFALGLAKACTIAAPALLGLALDELIRGKWPIGLFLGYGALRFGVSVFEEGQRLLYLRVKELAYHEIAVNAFSHLHGLSLHWHVSKRSGVILRSMERGINSASTIVDVLFLRLVPTLLEALVLAIIFGTVYGSPGSAAILAASFTFYILVTVGMTRWRRKIRMVQHRTDNEASSIAVDSLTGFETVKSFTAELYELARYSSAIRAYQKASKQSQTSLVALNLTQSLIMRSAAVAVLIVNAHDVLSGRLSIGGLVAVQTWTAQLFGPLAWLGSLYSMIIAAMTDMQGLADLMGQSSDVQDAPGAGPLIYSADRGVTVEFRDVVFSYPTTIDNVEAQMDSQKKIEDADAERAEAGKRKREVLVQSAKSSAKTAAMRVGSAMGLSVRGHARLADESGEREADTRPIGAAPIDAVAVAVGAPASASDASTGSTKPLHGIDKNGGRAAAAASPSEALVPGGAGAPSGGTGGTGGAEPGAKKPPRVILKGVSFTIPAGKTTAVVGATGSGKSTLARLLFRFFDVTGGAVLIDGQDVRSVTQTSVRGAIGIVPQDTVLFNDTLRYNMLYGRPTASMADVEAAAAAAQLTDFISRQPLGYETRVGERGLKLSGGEKQRVAIARTLLKDPPVLVLDEATSSLDTITESSVQAALNGVQRGRTTLVIAHRLSTIRDADEILVLDDGLIVERGTHEHLIDLGGRYAALWFNQIKERSNVAPAALDDPESGGGKL